MTDTTVAQALETKVCGRCGGSGHYSYCQMYGTICFGCAGRKVVFTKRGLAANEYLRKLRSKPAAEIQVGDQIQADSITMGGQSYSAWYTVVSIATNLSDRTLQIDLTSKKGGGLLLSNADPASLIRVAQTAEQKTATFKLALEYQATLTQAGIPRKGSAPTAEQVAKAETHKVAKAAAKAEEAARVEAERAVERAARVAEFEAKAVKEQEEREVCEVKFANENVWVIDVLKKASRYNGDFCLSVAADLCKKSVTDLSDKCLSIVGEIYAKSFGRGGSKAYNAALDAFYDRVEGVQVGA